MADVSALMVRHSNGFVFVFFLLINHPHTFAHSWLLVRQTYMLTDLSGAHLGAVGAGLLQILDRANAVTRLDICHQLIRWRPAPTRASMLNLLEISRGAITVAY